MFIQTINTTKNSVYEKKQAIFIIHTHTKYIFNIGYLQNCKYSIITNKIIIIYANIHKHICIIISIHILSFGCVYLLNKHNTYLLFAMYDAKHCILAMCISLCQFVCISIHTSNQIHSNTNYKHKYSFSSPFSNLYPKFQYL